jgi:hypothetical protein
MMDDGWWIAKIGEKKVESFECLRYFGEMKDKILSRPSLSGVIVLCGLIAMFVYVVIRAYSVGFTHDEALSFEMIHGDMSHFYSANNHWLNTGIMFVSSKVFGDSELSLRSSALIGFLFYGWFVYLILRKEVWWKAILGFTLLVLNPYLLDFFSLARGYGLSLGLAMGGIYYLLKFDKEESFENQLKNFRRALVFVCIATLANLILFNLVFVFLIFFFFQFGLNYLAQKDWWTKDRIIKVISVFAVVVVFLSVCAAWLLFLKKRNELYFGGETGFIKDTLTVMIHRSIYASYYGEEFWQILRDVLVGSFFVGLLYVVLRREDNQFSRSFYLLASMILVVLMQFVLLDSRLPQERTSLIFIVLLLMSVYFFVSQEVKWSWLSNTRIFAVALPLVFFLSFHFYQNINFWSCREWKDDSGMEQRVMQAMEDGNLEEVMGLPSGRYYMAVGGR